MKQTKRLTCFFPLFSSNINTFIYAFTYEFEIFFSFIDCTLQGSFLCKRSLLLIDIQIHIFKYHGFYSFALMGVCFFTLPNVKRYVVGQWLSSKNVGKSLLVTFSNPQVDRVSHRHIKIQFHAWAGKLTCNCYFF